MNQMRTEGETTSTQASGFASSTVSYPVIGTVRTGLAGADDAIVDRLPAEYLDRSVADAVSYLTTRASQSSDKASLAESVRRESSAKGSVLVINGRTAKLEDTLRSYAQEKTEGNQTYLGLEIEVSAVQQGGLSYLLN